MSVQLYIRTFTKNAYRAIRIALVNSGIGTLGVSGMTFSAVIDYDDYALLIDILRMETKRAAVDESEYSIETAQIIALKGQSDSRPERAI